MASSEKTFSGSSADRHGEILVHKNDDTPVPEAEDSAVSGEEVPAVSTIEIEMPDGSLRTYSDADVLKADVLNGAIEKRHRARRIIPVAVDDSEDGDADETDGPSVVLQPQEWGTVGSLEELRSLYTPIWGTALDYVVPGIIVGIALKALDTTVTLFAVDDTLGMLWLFAVGCILATARFGWIPIALYFFVTFKNFSQVPNFFLAAMAVALVGAIFGAPGGMVVGTIVGFIRSRRLAEKIEIDNEGAISFLKGLILPGAFLAIALPLYIFWLTPAIMEWMAS